MAEQHQFGNIFLAGKTGTVRKLLSFSRWPCTDQHMTAAVRSAPAISLALFLVKFPCTRRPYGDKIRVGYIVVDQSQGALKIHADGLLWRKSGEGKNLEISNAGARSLTIRCASCNSKVQSPSMPPLREARGEPTR